MVSNDSSNPVASTNELVVECLDAPPEGEARPGVPRTRTTQTAPLRSQRSHVSVPRDQTHFLRFLKHRSHAGRAAESIVPVNCDTDTSCTCCQFVLFGQSVPASGVNKCKCTELVCSDCGLASNVPNCYVEVRDVRSSVVRICSECGLA